MSNERSEESKQLSRLQRRHAKLQALLEVAKELGAKRHVANLLDYILAETARIIQADRCSLFVVDKERQELRSQIAHGLVEGDVIRVPMGKGIAGKCAASQEPILIKDAYEDPRHHPDVDQRTGYRTRSILTVPMIDVDGACVGVIQALNKIGDDQSFDEDDQDLLLAFAGHAAVALENAVLHEDIINLFEGFIKASVYAVEARDPTTSGHSERVALLTVGVAEALNRAPPPVYRNVHFSDAQIRELRYAALLHDFGKVGVRENVLVKSKKLHHHQLKELRIRFDYAQKERENIALREQIALLRSGVGQREIEERFGQIDEGLRLDCEQIEEYWDLVLQTNQPTVVEQSGFEFLREISKVSITDPRGRKRPLLTQEEVVDLSIPRGTLNEHERKEIQSHVTYTMKFLQQIPWTSDLAHVPEIAGKHHEKLDGMGYPHRLPAAEIPIQSRMMAVCDIYDALTASDRPYKKAVPHSRALDILKYEALDNKIDADLLELFVSARVYDVVYRYE
jgi:HD-GYP domain-containing protein (c-di-GMP phosphodiesterase class II)